MLSAAPLFTTGRRAGASIQGLQGRQRDDQAWDVAHAQRRDGGGWPFGLEELEPCHDKVEYELGVSGQAGNIRAKSTSVERLEGATHTRIPDAAARTDFTELMAKTAGKLAGTLSGASCDQFWGYDDRPGCMYHGFAAVVGVQISAKNSTAVSTIPRRPAAQNRHARYSHECRCRKEERPRHRGDLY
jgi:hypothetical protein